VPVGTQIFANDKETLLYDLTEVGQKICFLKGGIGGRGNLRFKTSTYQAPRYADPGMPGEEMWIWLRLKLLADVGLVGLPNAGKSTFLAACTRAKPKIADYPFTTLVPQLGVVYHQDQEFVLADIPGLIAGAHEGYGLGDRFLGHIERCRVLLHLIDGTQEDVIEAYKIIRHELQEYGLGLGEKPEMIALNKSDALLEEEVQDKKRALESYTQGPVHVLSGVSIQGVSSLLTTLLTYVYPISHGNSWA
jgi:GTP-binding protein